MDITTARAIIADNSRAPHMADWMLAGRVLYAHWQKHPEELRPATYTTDAPRRRKETRDDLLRSIRDLSAKLKRGKLTRDADLEGTQWMQPGGSDPTVGGKRILKLDGPASAYAIQAAGDGVWLIQIGDIEGIGDPGKGIPSPIPTGGTVAAGDAISRHKRTTAQRDQGATWAAKQNERMRAKWGQ